MTAPRSQFSNCRNAVLDPRVGVRMGERPRTARSCLTIAITLLIVAGFLTVAQVEQPAAADPVCDPAAVMNHRLDELGRSGYVWTIEPLDGPSGVTLIDEHEVKISPTVTCALMVTVVNHEWMHTLQGHKYGTSMQVLAAYGAFEGEMVADCGSMLLGSIWTPYIDQRRHETGDGCSDYELYAARELIDNAISPARR